MKQKSKLILGTMITLLIATLLTGCMEINGKISVTKKGAVTMTTRQYVDDEGLSSSIASFGGSSADKDDAVKNLIDDGYTKEIIDGKLYYVSKPDTRQYSSISNYYQFVYKESGMETASQIQLAETFLYSGDMNSLSGEAGLSSFDNLMSLALLKDMSFAITAEFAYPIKKVDSFGVINPENPNQVTWKMSFPELEKMKEMYAYCDSQINVTGVTQGILTKKSVTLGYSGAQTAVMDGKRIPNNTTFDKTGTYNIILTNGDEQRTVYFMIDKTPPSISGVSKNSLRRKTASITVKDTYHLKSVKLDGKEQIITDFDTCKFTVSANGKHKIVAEDICGNQNTLSFTIDTKKPKVTGVKNKKVYKKAVTIKFSDKNGIKKATLNGKKIKKGKKVTKNGSYTLKVTDKAGNVTKVKFTIKK